MVRVAGFPVAPFFHHAHGLSQHPALPILEPEPVAKSPLIHPDMEVMAGDRRIGKITALLTLGDVRYLQIRPYGLSEDSLYVPVSAIQVVGEHFVAIWARPEELLSDIWHRLPDTEEVVLAAA